MPAFTLHAACLHSCGSELDIPGYRVRFSDIAKFNGQPLRVVLHPRWCKSCAVKRMRIIADTENVLPDTTPYQTGEEEAFLQGVKFGRRAAVSLDFEMGFQEAEQSVLGWNPFAPRNDPSDMYRTICPILRGEPAMDFMLRLFSHARDLNRPIQEFPNDMVRIEETMKQAGLSKKQKDLVVRVIRRYRHGQMKGLYWQWRLERLAFNERNNYKRASLFREAMVKMMPRVEKVVRERM